jgi:hypothetical protein
VIARFFESGPCPKCQVYSNDRKRVLQGLRDSVDAGMQKNVCNVTFWKEGVDILGNYSEKDVQRTKRY